MSILRDVVKGTVLILNSNVTPCRRINPTIYIMKSNIGCTKYIIICRSIFFVEPTICNK